MVLYVLGSNTCDVDYDFSTFAKQNNKVSGNTGVDIIDSLTHAARTFLFIFFFITDKGLYIQGTNENRQGGPTSRLDRP